MKNNTQKSDKEESRRIKHEANLFDKIFKEVSEWPILNLLFKRWGKKIEKWTYVKTKMQTTYEREIDTGIIVTSDSVEMLIHLEYQSSNDPEMIFRMFEYVAMLTRRFPDKIIKSTVIYVGDEKPTMATKLKPEQVFTGYELINMKSISYKEMLESNDPKTILHAILADYPKEQGEEIVHKIVARLRKCCKTQAKLVQRCHQLQVFSFLRNLGLVTNKILKNMSIHIDIAETDLFKETFRPQVLELERKVKEAEEAKKAVETAAQEKLFSTISKLLKVGALTEHQIAEITDTDLQLILQIKKDTLPN